MRGVIQNAGPGRFPSIWFIIAGLVFLWSLTIEAQSTTRKALPGHVPAAVAHLAPIGPCPPTNHLHLAIGLPLRNQAALDEFLQQLSDPASTNYHKFLTPSEYAERFGPTEQDYQAVVRFVEANGLKVTATSGNRVILDVDGAVGDIERAFHVTLKVYQHPTESRIFYAPDIDPSVPSDLAVLSISGLDNFSIPRPRSLQPESQKKSPDAVPRLGSGPSGSYAGNDFRAAYVPGVTLNGSGESLALLEFDGYYSGDISSYETTYGLPAVTLTNVAVDGGVGTPGSGNSEVALDIEMVVDLAPGLARVLVYEAPNTSPWPDILNRIANDNLARQISCSWGGGPADPTSEQIFKQMIAQGQSFFNASGDSDAFSGAIPFPSESTNITQVGGTTLSTTGAGGAWSGEVVWNWGFSKGKSTGSSGGISTVYGIPDWQLGINMVTNHGSTTMRNIPDVALTADNISVKYNNGQTATFGGTSAAAPLWAAFTALVNQQRAINSKAPVGFINPAVYSIGKGKAYPATFHDITVGNNFNHSSPSDFSAAPGYDLCTGWGTPNGSNAITAMALRLFIVTQPAGQTVPAGSNVTFTVVVDGDGPFSYAWRSNNVVFSSTSPGGLTNTLTLPAVTTNSAANYSVAISNSWGGLVSSVAALTVTQVVAGNHLPVLPGIANKVVNELALLTFTNVATDPDGNLLAYSLDFGAPTNAVINLTNGVFSWTPTEAQGPSTNVITVRVTDNGTPPLSATQSFTVTINEINQAPVLSGIPDKSINETTMLTLTNAAFDADIPANTLTYSLDPGAPTNATVNPATGVFSWTPNEGQGPGTNVIAVRVVDSGTPPLSATQAFTVVVLESNRPPVLAAISNFTILEQTTLTFANTATDPDVPANALTFSLAAGAPTNATVDPATGVFSWTPTEAQGPSTNLISMLAIDNGSPLLSATQSFTIVVLESNSPPILAPVVDRTIHVGSPLTITNSASDLDIPANAVAFSLTNAPAGAAIDPASGVFTWTPPLLFANTTNSVTVIATDHNPYAAIQDLVDAKTFQVVVMPPPSFSSSQPILFSNGLVTLVWTAIPGQVYRVQSSGDLQPAGWSDLLPDVLATNVVASKTDAVGTSFFRFYRVSPAP